MIKSRTSNSVPLTRSDCERLGAVYTPQVLAEWASELLFDRMEKHRVPVVLDPACGHGALLQAVRLRAGKRATLIGGDIDAAAVSAVSKLALGIQAHLVNALSPMTDQSPIAAWKRLLGGRRPDAIIANPPWGAKLDLSAAELKELGYELATGQFDSFDVFVELSLNLVRRGGHCLFILPDSLFLPEHKSVRKLLATRTQLCLIARLGEGFFKGVYRGTVIVLAKNVAPATGATVECMRLTRAWRDRALAGRATLSDARTTLSHSVEQSRFIKDPEHRFDIDVSQRDEAIVSKISANEVTWTSSLISGRGVELSKSGRIITCDRCGISRPAPRVTGTVRCDECGFTIRAIPSSFKQIVRKSTVSNRSWAALITGEDVDRYHAAPSRSIRRGIAGINYKSDSSFSTRKLLVRKTGVGLKSSIDDSGALTTQVVFHYFLDPRLSTPAWHLDYVLGVLSSRVMLAYHLKRIGENEWRSHPYVTQRTLAQLPIPMYGPDHEMWIQMRAVARTAARLMKSRTSVRLDLELEGLVAGLFGLTEEDMLWVSGVLESAQSLQPIASLRIPSGCRVIPVRVGR
jgi:adenine-specific DNA-methyltransferase